MINQWVSTQAANENLTNCGNPVPPSLVKSLMERGFSEDYVRFAQGGRPAEFDLMDNDGQFQSLSHDCSETIRIARTMEEIEAAGKLWVRYLRELTVTILTLHKDDDRPKLLETTRICPQRWQLVCARRRCRSTMFPACII